MFDHTQGAMRVSIDRDEMEQLRDAGTLAIDFRRRRPRYFDGRFLAARDLTRDQTYFLTRQADLGRAGGAGVVRGLMVRRTNKATSIQLQAGYGVTPAGEIVVLREHVEVDLSDIAEMQRLDAAFGIIPIPRTPARNRSGLFIVALRPVEYTANPIASYPTSITEERTIEDGDIVEAVAITLVPYGDTGNNTELEMRRSYVAHEIFVAGGQRRRLPVGILPLAIIALDRGVVRWIDPFMVRREVGAEHGDVLGLGFSPRALREAYLLQYHAHLQEILRIRDAAGRGFRFSAAEHFLALPPAGMMPKAAINTQDFSQIFFPPEVDVELSIVPEDELPVLLEESLLLPPIDLTLTGDELESTAIQILVPVPRRNVRRISLMLQSFTREIKAPIPGLVAKRQPLEALQLLRSPQAPPFATKPESIVDAQWRKLLANQDMLWYSRRRNLQQKADIVGIRVSLLGKEMEIEKSLISTLKEQMLYTRFTNLKRRGSAEADAEMVALLASKKFKSKLLMEDTISALENLKKVDQVSVLQVAERYSDPEFGEGIKLLVDEEEGLTTRITSKMLVESGVLPEIDTLAKNVPAEELPALAKELKNLARTGDQAKRPERIVNFVREAIGEIVK